MDRKRRLARIGFALTLLTTLLAGFERLEAGKRAQGFLFLAGAAIGAFVYLRRRRREARADTAEAAQVARAADTAADERGDEA
ncbi:MAG: hypothetical protein KDB94_05175 [Acidobacteria bacterium]|nr:hypothetical protein [Acidobacteriota bacterium]MCB9378607.1 hypothetical protein [Holophagales bacterium]